MIKLRTVINVGFFYLLFLFFMLFMIMKSDINKFICILCVHLSLIIFENFKDDAIDQLANLHSVTLRYFVPLP